MVAAHLRRVLVFVIDDNIFIRCYLLYWKFLHTSIFRNIHLILSVFSAHAILKCLVSQCKRPEIFIFMVIKVSVKVELKTTFSVANKKCWNSISFVGAQSTECCKWWAIKANTFHIERIRNQFLTRTYSPGRFFQTSEFELKTTEPLISFFTASFSNRPQ